MHGEAYRLMADLETAHWWYRGRRAVVARLLRTLDLPPGSRILDVGAGTGGNLGLLAGFGEVLGVEPSAIGAELGLGRGAWASRVLRARAEALPFLSGTFELVTALDVLEHLHDEIDALDELRRVLRPGGVVVVHVPAYRLLWGHEDVISRHLRRYRRGEIGRLLVAAGFDLIHLGYVNALLLPVVAAVKIGKRLLLPAADGTGATTVHADVASLPPAFVNRVLSGILEAEAEVAATAELPFGASILAAARRRE